MVDIIHVLTFYRILSDAFQYQTVHCCINPVWELKKVTMAIPVQLLLLCLEFCGLYLSLDLQWKPSAEYNRSFKK